MLSYDAMYAVIAIGGSMLVCSETVRDLTVRVFAPMLRFCAPMLPEAFKFGVCATVLYGALPYLHG